ncbi:MAG: isocitrate lyase/phosphoenolpyruvate mutase family protein [Burkholderiales bacterium]|nr:isocitrate lyase/phosphoenolpyruvate mutase family protein [Burkholderiales bacterium]
MSEAAPVSQAAKAASFRALHEREGAFVIANPWDAGSARLLADLGFEALATSSGAAAAVRGRKDGQLGRDDAMAHAKELVAATDLPIAGDMENGFGETPEHVAETVRLAAAAGLVGCSIEDFTGDKAKPFYDLDLAVRRIAAAAEAARALPFPFTLTARCEHFLRGHADLGATIARLQAYEAAGADVLFAPALPDLESIRTVCAALKKPLNFMAGIPGKSFSVAALAGVGVKRISLATSLYRAAMKAVREAATEVRTSGSFGYIDRL